MALVLPHKRPVAPGAAAADYFRPAAQPREVVIADALDCVTEAAHRIGNGAAAGYSCGRHRFEVVSSHWKREPNLPIYDLPAGNGHRCNEVRLAEAKRQEVSRG
jgi:hypothetical protein